MPGAHEPAHGAIHDMAWHPLGHILATGSQDLKTKFWCRKRNGAYALHQGEAAEPGADVAEDSAGSGSRAGAGIYGPSSGSPMTPPAAPRAPPMQPAVVGSPDPVQKVMPTLSAPRRACAAPNALSPHNPPPDPQGRHQCLWPIDHGASESSRRQT